MRKLLKKAVPYLGKRDGLTVTEFVSIVAVILILATLLLPMFLRVREMGRSAKCVANLKQLIQAVRLYVDDDPQGRFPGWTAGGKVGTWDDFKQLMPLLVTYLGDKAAVNYKLGELDIFRCPSNDYDGWYALRVDAYGNRTDYEYNGMINNTVVERKVANPEWVAVLYDWPVDPTPPVLNIHRGGSNFAFYDGHVQWFSHSQMMTPHAPKWDESRKYDTWGLK